ncbi:hypothetical protein TomMM35A_17700 [Sphingobium sp. TomMM35A]
MRGAGPLRQDKPITAQGLQCSLDGATAGACRFSERMAGPCLAVTEKCNDLWVSRSDERLQQNDCGCAKRIQPIAFGRCGYIAQASQQAT